MFELRPILKTYYDALEEGKVLGMKCEDCEDVVWRPLPTCQKCGGTNLKWVEMGDEAIIDEFIYDDTSLKGDYTFTKANQYFVSKEAYCVCVGHFKGGNEFHAALYGVTKDNRDELSEKLPFLAKIEFIQMDGGFKSVGFRVKE